MFKHYFFILLFGLLAVAARAQQTKAPDGKYELAGISVEGVQFLDKNAIVNLSGLAIGQTITIPGDELTDAIKKLWKQNIFADVKIEVENVEDGKIFLKIILDERPRISKYTFEGVTKSHADDLREKMNLVRGQRFTEAKKRSAIRAIKNFYNEKGYLNCEVTVKALKDQAVPNGVIIVLAVAKGRKVKIDDIEIEGNLEIKTSMLKKKLKNTKQKVFYRVWSRSKYIPGKFGEDKQAMLSYMHSKGFRDARILWDTVYKSGENNVKLHIKLYEGNRYYYRNIEWVGNFKYSAGRLDTLLGIRKGDVYDTELLQKRLTMDPGGTDVSSLYLDDGYLFFRAEPVEVAVVGDSIDLEIRVYEGQQAVYDRIIIEGNDKTSDHVILREVRTLPGQKFSRSELIRSQREIMNLGFFNQENMQVIPIPNPEKGTVDIKYVVEEKPSDQLFFQGGWGGRIRDAYGNLIGGGLVATVGVTFNNFSLRKMLDPKAWRPLPAGDGQKLSLRIQVNGITFQNYSISFQEPWFGGKKPNSLGFTLSYSRQSSPTSNYLLSMFSGSIDLGRRMTWPDDYFRSYTRLRYSFYDTQNAGYVFSGINNGQFHILSLRQTFDRTSIDAPIYPKRGSILQLSMEGTLPWSAFIKKDYANLEAGEKFKLIEFYKVKFQAEAFLQVTQNKLPMVFYGRALFGMTGFYNKNIGLSPFELFKIGGSGLYGMNLNGTEYIALRGYNDSANLGSAAGNAIYNKFTFEIRQPITLSPSATVWILGFAEGGYGWRSFDNFSPFNIKRSVGGGVRIFLPIFGLLGVDYGWGLDPEENDPTKASGGHFHFMLGQQF